MNKKLDSSFRHWLERFSDEWKMPIAQVALVIRVDEIRNRLQTYPKVSAVLSISPLDIYKFSETVRECWALGHRVDAIRFNEFISKADAATSIQELIDNFPTGEEDAITRINDSLIRFVNLGYKNSSGSFDWAGAAQFMSVILTSLYPTRFVDFRQNRWNTLADTLEYARLPSDATYGEKLVWAGTFARDISQTKTYKEHWPEAESLWIISGICWKNTSIRKPVAEPTDIDILSFPEGAQKRRLHLLRERNRAVVSRAKTLGLEADPLLRCQICGFSFVEVYGQIGHGFIEAHHKQPVATLRAGSRTIVSDIALVCANCHRMLHRGDRTLDIDELRGIVKGQEQ